MSAGSPSSGLRLSLRRTGAILPVVGGASLAISVLITLIVFAPVSSEQGEVPRDPLITAAAIVFFISGFSALASAIPSLFYISQTGELPGIGSIRFYGDALFERLWGIPGILVSLVPFAVLGAFEMLAGVWLWRSLHVGGVLALWLTHFAVVFLVGYGAPFYWVVVPLRVVLVGMARSTLA